MTDKKRATVFLVALAGLLGSFAILAGPVSAEQSGGAVADPTSTASGNAVAIDGSVASGNATAIDDSTASGDAVAVHGSTASGCSLASDHSTASGGAEPCPLAKHHKVTHETPKHVRPAAGHVATARPVRSLAVTGVSTGVLLAAAAIVLLIGANLWAHTYDRRRATAA